MRFSIRDIFSVGDASFGSDTHALLETYGISEDNKDDSGNPDAHADVSESPDDAQTSVDKNEMSPIVSEAKSRVVNRDDIALKRWRKMAGLK